MLCSHTFHSFVKTSISLLMLHSCLVCPQSMTCRVTGRLVKMLFTPQGALHILQLVGYSEASDAWLEQGARTFWVQHMPCIMGVHDYCRVACVHVMTAKFSCCKCHTVPFIHSGIQTLTWERVIYLVTWVKGNVQTSYILSWWHCLYKVATACIFPCCMQTTWMPSAAASSWPTS